MNISKTKTNTEPSSMMREYCSILYEHAEQEYPNLKKAMSVGVDPVFREKITTGTLAKEWHFTHLQMVLENIYVTTFMKEVPSHDDRIAYTDLQVKLQAEFQNISHL